MKKKIIILTAVMLALGTAMTFLKRRKYARADRRDTI